MKPCLFAALAAALAVFGQPATAAPPPIATYGKLPALDLVRLSPSGDRIAFVAVDGENRKLFVRNVGGDAVLSNEVGASKIRNLEWAGEDFILVTASATLKFGNGHIDKWTYSTRDELYVILIVNIKTKQVSRMFADQMDHIFLGGAIDEGVRNIDGHWCDFVSAVSIRGAVDLYKVDLETGRYSKVSTLTDDVTGIIDAKGAIAARARYDENTRVWSLFAGDHGSTVVARRRSDLDTTSLIGFGRTAGTALVQDDGDTETLEEYPLSASSSPTLLFDGLNVRSALSDRTSHLLIGATVYGPRGAVFFDPEQQHRYDAVLKAFPNLRVKLESYSDDFGKVVVETDGGDDPGTHWLIDLKTGKAQDLMPAYPIEPADVGPTRMFSYKAADGLAMEGVLTLPPGSSGKNLPVVVMPHGGPLGVVDEVKFDFWAQAFASRGYAVFQPNYRGSGGYGASFRHAGFGQWGRGMLSDISDGVSALAQAGIIDRKRACIVGASYGGYAALAGVTIQHGQYRCAVAVSGVSNVGALMTSVGYDPSTAGGRYSQAMFGVSFAGDAALAQISPLDHADRADAPILLIHGKDDTTVPFVHSNSMASALKEAGKPVEFVQLEGEDHYWSHEKTRVQILEATVAFVQKYNPAN